MFSERVVMGKAEELNRISELYNSERDFDFYLIRYGFQTMLPFLQGPRILELGCASGVMTELLATAFPKVDVIDGSKKYIQNVKNKLGDNPNLRFYVSLFEDFEPDKLYDSIILARALEHIGNPIGLLRRISSWLRQGAGLHIVVPNADSLHRRIGVEMGLLDKRDTLSERDLKFGHKRVYDFQLLNEHVQKAGLSIIHHEGVFLKPLSNAQMEDWNKKLLDALFVVGKKLPDYCAEIYVVCQCK